MGREHVGPARGGAAEERRSQARHSGRARLRKCEAPYGIIARLRHGAHADGVGLEFLLAREARERQLRLLLSCWPPARIVQHLARDLAEQRRALLELDALDRMPRRHMRHLMRQHCGDLRGAVRESEKASREVEMAVGQREGVDGRRIQHRDLVGDGQARSRRRRGGTPRRRAGFRPLVGIDPAEGRDQGALVPAAPAPACRRAR